MSRIEPFSPGPAPPSGAMVELAPGIRVVESSLRFQYARSSGPGGQNVNKVNTKAEVWVAVEALLAGGLWPRATQRLHSLAGRRITDAGEIHLACDTHRSQQANRDAVMDRLRELLVTAMHEPKARRKTRPSRASRQRRLDSKRRRSQVKKQRHTDGGE